MTEDDLTRAKVRADALVQPRAGEDERLKAGVRADVFALVAEVQLLRRDLALALRTGGTISRGDNPGCEEGNPDCNGVDYRCNACIEAGR